MAGPEYYFVKCLRGITAVLEKESKVCNKAYENKNGNVSHKRIEKNYKLPF